MAIFAILPDYRLHYFFTILYWSALKEQEVAEYKFAKCLSAVAM